MSFFGTPYSTNDSRGAGNIREALDNTISIIATNETPLLSNMATTGLDSNNTYFEWQLDDNPTPTATAWAEEGKEMDMDTEAIMTSRFRAASYVGIVRLGVNVSDTQRLMNLAGVGDEFAYQTYKQSVNVLKQMEYNLHWSEYADGGGGGSLADRRATHGVVPWLGWLGDIAGGTDPSRTEDVTLAGKTWLAASSLTADSNYRPFFVPGGATTAAPADLTREAFNTQILKPAMDQGMNMQDACVLVGSSLKLTISKFANVYDGTTPVFSLNERNVSADEKKVTDVIDHFSSDFGVLQMNMDRYLNGTTDKTLTPEGATIDTLDVKPSQTVLVLEKAFWEHKVLQGCSFTPLAKTGDATQGMVLIQSGLKCYNPKAGVGGYNWA